MKPFLISNNDIFNVSEVTQTPLFIDNTNLKSIEKEISINVDVTSISKDGSFKFNDDYEYGSDDYRIGYKSGYNI
ncbi:UNVERIFIED_CONTAM: hypothetical protein O8I53_13620 [Campylobacter lari]